MTDAMEDGTAAAAALVVGRVPVVDEAGTIVGFELVNRASAGHGASTTAQGREAVVSMSGLLGTVDVDVDSVVGDRLLFCTIGRDVLVGDSPLHLSPRRTVVEVPMLADDPELLEAVRAFRDVGFTVLVPHSARTPGTAGLLDLADLVKVDLGTGTPEEVMDVVQGYAGGPADLLAAGCDTEERLAWAQAVGFQLFSGSAVKSPPISGSSTIAPSALSQVQLGMELLSQELDLARIEKVLRRDPALVAQVLNMASSGAGGGLRRQVRSLREALVVLGTVRIRQWAALVILSRHGRVESDALVTALVRARTCELLAPDHGIDGPFAFTAALLSALDIVLGVPITHIEDRVQLDPELRRAAFRRQGDLGNLITTLEVHERTTEAGRAPDPAHGDTTEVEAMAFTWAAGQAGTMAPAGASRSYRPRRRPALR